ncbi:MAG: ornithine cyclodeaminase family protein [Alphaproteobacteria bacterium]|nr:ornithine cyclodeaminase family protein [Alphaproteobacteria bacterium]
MRSIDAAAVHAALPYDRLIPHLREAFRAGGEVPLRSRFHIDAVDGGAGGTLLLMPAWQPGRHIGIKTVSVFPDNAKLGHGSVAATYLLLDARTGFPKAVIDGEAVTLRRTGCASALAASYLVRQEARHLLMVGAGSLAPHLIRAHCTVRNYTRIEIWNRNRARAEQTAADLRDLGVVVVDDLEAAVRAADTISCATLSRDPLVRGDWLKPGAHLDLVGAFTPEMHETDATALSRSSVYVDNRAGALKEPGDLVTPIKAGQFKAEDVRGDLFDLCRADVTARQNDAEITLFKSVGLALEDLAAAELVVEGQQT